MAKGSANSSHVASCADYNSDDGELLDTRKQANVAAKRSGGLGKDSPAMTPTSAQAQRPIPDRSSDSGYSSRTHVTDVSADSTKSSKGAEQASSTTSDVHTATSSGCGSRVEIVTVDGVKYKKCADPNCPKRHKSKKSKSAKAEASSTKAAASSSRRQPSPKRVPSKQKEPEPEAKRPQLRPRAASASNPRPQSFHGTMPPFYPQGRPPVAYYRSGYPMHPAAGQLGYMVPNRAIMERPGLPRITTDVSARGPRSAGSVGPYGRPVIRQDKPKTVVSARTPSSSKFPDQVAVSDSEEDDDDDDEDEEYSDELARKLQRLEAHQKAQELERRRKAEYAAMERALKIERDAKQMPPPPKPASILKPNLSMRQAGPSINPKVTYGAPVSNGYNSLEEQARHIALATRPALNPMGGSVKVPYSTTAIDTRAYLSGDPALSGHPRRNSYYGNETVADLEAHHALIARTEEMARQYEAQRRFKQEATRGYDPQLIRDSIRRGSQGSVDDRTPRKTESHIRQAQSHIDKSRNNPTSGQVHPLTEGTLRQAGIERKSSHRSKRSSKDGSSTGARRSSNASQSQIESVYDADGFKIKINPKQPYEFDVGNQRVQLLPNSEGGMEFVYVGGKRETPYYSTNGSASTGSKLGRRSSQRKSQYHDDDDSAEEYDAPKSRRDAPRRRAETVSSYVESDTSRRTVRRSQQEEEYRGPPMYGVSPDEYGFPAQKNKFSQAHREPPSPRQGHGGFSGNVKQNFFGA